MRLVVVAQPIEMFADEALGATWVGEELVGAQVSQIAVGFVVVLAKRAMQESTDPVWTRGLPMVAHTVLKVVGMDIDILTDAELPLRWMLYGVGAVVWSDFSVGAFFFVFE